MASATRNGAAGPGMRSPQTFSEIIKILVSLRCGRLRASPGDGEGGRRGAAPRRALRIWGYFAFQRGGAAGRSEPFRSRWGCGNHGEQPAAGPSCSPGNAASPGRLCREEAVPPGAGARPLVPQLRGCLLPASPSGTFTGSASSAKCLEITSSG